MMQSVDQLKSSEREREKEREKEREREKKGERTERDFCTIDLHPIDK